MSNRLGKLLSTFFIASFAGSMLAIAAHSPAHADDTCLSGPKTTTPRGSHWYYRVEPGTKRHCWYLGEGRGKTTQRVAAKHSSPAPPTPGKPTQTSAAPPLQPAVANAHAEFDDVARNQANTNPSQSDTASSAMRDQASADPLPSDTAPAEATQTADASPAAVTTRWPDPAINTASAINVAQQPAPAATVTPSPQLPDDRPTPAAATAPTPHLLGERSEPGPALNIVGAPESEASTYSMPLLLGGLAGALAFAGLLGFAVVKFGDLSSFMHIRHRSESIWDVVDTGHLPPWQQRGHDFAPTPTRDPLRARREIEAQSRDIMEILSRASRGATT